MNASGEPTSTAARTEETTNFEISKTVRNIVKQTGGVKKISAFVLIDGTYTTDKDGNKTYQPRTDAEIKNITALVSTAIGLDQKRGDKLEVINMQFADIDTTPTDDGTKLLGFERSDLLDAAEVLTVAIMIILVVLLVLQPMVGRLLSQENAGGDGNGADGMDPMGLLPNAVGQNPASSSFILSKIITLVPTAKPMVSTKPVIPAAVNVKPIAVNTPMVNS